MDLFRITRRKYADDLTGEGARIHGGRWNSRGINLLYTSEHESLAALELLVHTSIQTLPNDLVTVILSVPDRAEKEEITSSDLPVNWRNYPAPAALADMGTEWILSKRSLLLKVPSAIIPGESNILINPGHREFTEVQKKGVRPFRPDPRLVE